MADLSNLLDYTVHNLKAGVFGYLITAIAPVPFRVMLNVKTLRENTEPVKLIASGLYTGLTDLIEASNGADLSHILSNDIGSFTGFYLGFKTSDYIVKKIKNI